MKNTGILNFKIMKKNIFSSEIIDLISYLKSISNNENYQVVDYNHYRVVFSLSESVNYTFDFYKNYFHIDFNYFKHAIEIYNTSLSYDFLNSESLEFYKKEVHDILMNPTKVEIFSCRGEIAKIVVDSSKDKEQDNGFTQTKNLKWCFLGKYKLEKTEIFNPYINQQ